MVLVQPSKPCSTLNCKGKQLLLCDPTTSNQAPDIVSLDAPANRPPGSGNLTAIPGDYHGSLLVMLHYAVVLQELHVKQSVQLA
jgi:hypothetical protein